MSLRLGISRPPLREALRILENEQLILSTPRKGAIISDLSIEGLKEACKARIMIESQSIDLLKENNIRELPKVESALANTSSMDPPSYENPEAMMTYLKAFVAYHTKLVESTGNSWLVRFHNAVFPTLIRYQFICLYIPGQPIKSKDQHEGILSLIESGKYAQAKKLLISHINTLVNILERRIIQREYLKR
jgi:DNA-binding GntR family transcriptional regulator